MRRQSKKRAKKQREVGPIRRAFIEEHPFCMVCEYAGPDLCVHEIASGSHRDAALSERLTWLVTCSYCNCHRMTDHAEYPLARQLAYKWMWDREYYDLEAFNILRGRAPGAITPAEVVPWILRETDGA